MADISDRYALPLLQSGQAQKEVTHNQAVAAIDALLHLAVASRSTAIAPPAPVAGSAWIVGAEAGGIWAGRAGMLALFDSAGWSFVAPRDGCLAYVLDEGVYAVRAGGSWHADAWPVRALAIGGRTMLAAAPPVLPPLAGGAVVDVQARAAIETLTNALRGMGLIAAG